MDPESVNRVEAFFRDEMTEEEARQFREDLADNEELNQLFKDYHLAMDTIDAQEEEELRSQFKEWSADKETPKANERKLFPQLWKVAASIALIAALSYLVFYLQSQPRDAYTLALNTYELPKSPGVELGKGAESWSAGLEAYQNKNFEEAVRNWTKIQDLSQEQEYFLAHAYFNLNYFTDAVSLFKVIADGNGNYSFAADWFLALAYLADNEDEAFLRQINKIKLTPNHPYKKDAELLLEKAQKVFSRRKD